MRQVKYIFDSKFWSFHFMCWMLANLVVDAGVNLTDFLQYRQKRHLIYPQGGNIKFIIGPVIPVNLQDLNNWRSLLVFYNIHIGDYPLPPNLAHLNHFLSKSFANDDHLSFKADTMRAYFYHVLEYFMDRQIGENLGHLCLLRLICQNAQIHHHMTLFADILNIILTPGKQYLDKSYVEAYNLGKKNIDCLKRYKSCARKLTFLDQIIRDDT